MMRLISILFLFFYSYQLIASDDCFQLALSYGDGRGKVEIPESCASYVSSLAQGKQKYISSDVSVAGYKNMIYTNFITTPTYIVSPEGQQTLLISGEQSRLTEVHALDVIEQEKEIFVLANSPKSIFVYRLHVGGNVSPIRKIYADNLQDISFIKASKSFNIIVAYDSEKNSLLSFRYYADKDSLNKERSIEKVKEISLSQYGIENLEDMKFIELSEEIELLNDQSGRPKRISKSLLTL